MAKRSTRGVFLIVCGGLLILLSGGELSDALFSSSMTEEAITFHILYVLVGILLLWRGISKARKSS